jgi:NADPH:quinone reductase-like Zn-dependent oxidoreductase
MSFPKTTESWTVEDKGSFDALKLKEVTIPELSDNEVLVKMHAASLNFRDLIIALVFLSSGVFT